MASIGLISCVSRKCDHACEARVLYDSPLFAKARQYVERHCSRWYILSARYGLVSPHDIIAPYDDTLNSKSRTERDKWADDVWEQLKHHVRPSDRIVILAGERYRERLLPKLIQYGCDVDTPMEGLGIGRQLQWLTSHTDTSNRAHDLNRLYNRLGMLASGLHGRPLLSQCTGKSDWPHRGIYLFFEPGELRSDRSHPRIVRVGTHAVSATSRTTIWNRLRTHRGTLEGLGNHRSSIFRLHIGAAMSLRDPRVGTPSWSKGQSASKATRDLERVLERAVSQHLATMSLLWLAVEDAPGPNSDRAYLERNLIGLLVGPTGPFDPPSSSWLGLFSPNERIRRSGLWNLDFLDYTYDRSFLDIIDYYVDVTLCKRPAPSTSIAPHGWHTADRHRLHQGQLPLFPDQ